jgi:hypothetical protein
METIDIVNQKGEKGKVEKLTVEHSHALGQILLLCIPHIEYMSKEAMYDWIMGACDLAEETLEWKKSSKIKSKITLIRKYFDKKYEKMTREHLANYLMNLVLSSEGMGTLPGFGYGVKGTSFSTNPEYIPITSDIKK